MLLMCEEISSYWSECRLLIHGSESQYSFSCESVIGWPSFPHRDVAGMCLTTEARTVLDGVLNEQLGMCSCLQAEASEFAQVSPVFSKWVFMPNANTPNTVTIWCT